MHKRLALPASWLVISLCGCVHLAQAQPPPQSARLSKLLTEGGYHGQRLIRPSSGVTYLRSPVEKTTRSERRAARRSAMAARYEQPRAVLRPVSPEAFQLPREPDFPKVGLLARPPTTFLPPPPAPEPLVRAPEAPRTGLFSRPASQLQRLRIQPPPVPPLPGEYERRLSLRMPPPAPAVEAPVAKNDPWFAETQEGGMAPKAAAAPSPAPSVAVPEPEVLKQAAGTVGRGGASVPQKAPPVASAPPAKERVGAGSAKPSKESPPPPKSSGGEFDHLPFGQPVPGKAGYVTLSGEHSSLPEIDVRGIAPGTPVEIPNPNVPGASIQFRVPERAE